MVRDVSGVYDGAGIMFGLVVGFEVELGYFFAF
jgi:hypothetical protein